MNPEELDEATVEEAKRRWLSTPALRIHGTLGEDVPFIAARLARENWTPPEPVDPDILAWREWAAMTYPSEAKNISAGSWDKMSEAYAYLAGARMAREQAKPLAQYLQDRADRDDAEADRILAKYRGEA